MTEQLNIVSIFCTISLKISDSADSKQRVLRNYVNQLFDIAYGHIGQTNRIILITQDGAEIAYLGSAEDAVLIATDILNGVSHASVPLQAYIGIHLEPVELTSHFSRHSNLITAAIHTAKQISDQAKPNEIVVSRTFHQNLPQHTQAQLTLFKNTEDEKLIETVTDVTNAVNANPDLLIEKQVAEQSVALTYTEQPKLEHTEKNYWKYIAIGLFAVLAVYSITLLIRTSSDDVPAKTALPSNVTEPMNETPPKVDTDALNPVIEEPQVVDKKIAKPAENNMRQKSKSKPQPVPKETGETGIKKLLNWETLKKNIKQGQKNECTQSEKALNQCR